MNTESISDMAHMFSKSRYKAHIHSSAIVMHDGENGRGEQEWIIQRHRQHCEQDTER